MANLSFRELLLSGALAMLICSCGQEVTAPPPPVKKALPAKPAAAPPGIDKTAGVAQTAIEVKLRNPFLSYIVVRQGSEEADKKAVKGPLQCCELALFKIQAIKTGGKNPRAMISAPDSKRYMVGIGDSMGTQGGKIVKIDEKSITVREYTKDAEGKVLLSNDVELKLHVDTTQTRP